MKKIKEYLKFNKTGKHYLFIERVIQTEQISVLEAIKYVLSFWKVVLIFAVIIGASSLLSVFKKVPETYTSKSVVIPDGGAPPKMDFGGELADLISQQAQPVGGGLGIESFPGIIENYPFLLGMLDEEILSESYGDYVTIGDYMAGLNQSNRFDQFMARLRNIPNKFLELFESKSSEIDTTAVLKSMPVDTLKVVTQNQLGLMQILSTHIKVEGMNAITIETVMPEPKVSTRLNNLVLEKLVEEVTRLRTAKQQRNLVLIKSQLDTVKRNFELSQENLAEFRDANKGNTSASFQTALERLTSEYNLYFGIYSSIATEYELAKIELIENTPFYDVIEPAYVPLLPDNSSGFSLSSLIKSAIIGIALGIVFVVLYTGILILKLLNQKLKETNI